MENTKIEPQVAEEFGALIASVKREIHKVIVGQEGLVDLTLQCIFCHNHALLMGVPGLAKTLLVTTISKVIGVSSQRIQFTPDLMPSDITGTEIIQEDPVTGRKQFVFVPGPIFASMVLADEINRTPPKTQAALLEAMEETSVSVAGTTRPLPLPFLVLATQNPIEQEGTYQLPMSQLDRFLFMVTIDYPSLPEEEKILWTTTRDALPALETIISGKAIMKYQDLVRRVPVSSYVANYAARLARATRPDNPLAPAFVPKWVQWGCGPRAGQSLLLAAKAHVLLNGRFNVSVSDVRAFAHPVLRHRFGLNFTAVSEGYNTDTVIDWLLDSVPWESDAGKRTGLFNFRRKSYGKA